MKKLEKKQKKIRTVRSYWNEYSLIDDMRKFSSRYLLSFDIDNLTDEQYAERESHAWKIIKYCSVKMRQVEKECLENTGKTIFSCLKPYTEVEKTEVEN